LAINKAKFKEIQESAKALAKVYGLGQDAGFKTIKGNYPDAERQEIAAEIAAKLEKEFQGRFECDARLRAVTIQKAFQGLFTFTWTEGRRTSKVNTKRMMRESIHLCANRNDDFIIIPLSRPRWRIALCTAMVVGTSFAKTVDLL